MPTALDADPSQLDQHEQNFVEKVRKHGWCSTHVAPRRGEEGVEFSYTTGFWLKFKFPEMILFSLKGQIAHDTFWYLYRELEAGKSFPVGVPTEEIFQGVAAVLLPVTPEQYSSYLGRNRWFYGNDKFQCLQLVWPDVSGDFPWSPGSSEDFRTTQPDLTAGHWSGLRERNN
jgi:hypothetical protein